MKETKQRNDRQKYIFLCTKDNIVITKVTFSGVVFTVE